MRRLAADRLQGEAYYLVAVTGCTLLALLAHYVSWAALDSIVTADPDTAWLAAYGWAQVASAVLIAATGLVGFRPGVVVTCRADEEVLHVQQGARSEAVPYAAIRTTETVTATTYHQHYRRYAAVHPFIGSTRAGVVLVRIVDADTMLAVALGSADDHRALRDHLLDVRAPAHTA